MEVQKKISFGFVKSSKQLNILTSKPISKKNDIELIDCLEGQSIKVKNVLEEKKQPLIIPLRDNAKNLFDRVKSATLNKNADENGEKPDSALSLDELAAKELIEEAAQRSSNAYNVIQTPKVQVLPISENKLPVQNDNESTLDDYNNVPVNDYGLAMLRGMGWTESTGIGNQNKQVTNVLEPELRPKGMGLGANKFIKLKEISVALDKDGKELSLTKGAFAKVIAGKHKGSYCEVLGLDDEAGRIIVKTSIQQTVLSLNEFLLTPVTKEEHTKNSKVLNSAKYEEYTKNNRNEHKRDSSDVKSSKREFKSSRRKSDSSVSDVEDDKHPVHKSKHDSKYYESTSNYKKHKKHQDRSRSPYNSKHKRSPSSADQDKRKSTRAEQYSDSNDDVDKQRTRKRKSKKHKKYEYDSGEDEYKKRKKSSKSSKKHRSHDDRHSSDEDRSRSKYKHKHSKKHK